LKPKQGRTKKKNPFSKIHTTNMKTDGRNGIREGSIHQQHPMKRISDRKQKKKLGDEHLKMKEMEQNQANVVKYLHDNPHVLYMQHVIEQQQRDGIVFTK
jgi:hypothetical protein